MAAYQGVEVTFLETNKYRVTWNSYYDWYLIYKERGDVLRPTLPTIQKIIGTASTDTSLVAAVRLLDYGSGEAVVTYDSTFNIIAIGLLPAYSDARFKEWRQHTGSSADAYFDSYSYYVWKDPSTLTPLSTPTGLNADQITSNSATISWNAVENATSYQITYTPSGGTSTTVTSSTNSVALTNLSGATSYSVEVVAVGDGTTYTDSSSSSALTFTTLQKLATPTGLKVTNDAVITTTAKQTITWNTVANATGYKLEYKQSTSTTWGSVTRTAPPVIFPNRTRNVSYEHRITALGDGTTYDDSDTSSVVTKKSKRQLATPTGLTCTNKTETTLTFSWNEVSGTKTYYLRYLLPTASSHSYVYASSSPATITGLTPGTTYNVDIGARVATDSTNYDGSVYTDKIPVTTLTQLSAPTGLTHDKVTSTSARVGWNAVTNAVDYKVEYRVQGATDWTEDQQ